MTEMHGIAQERGKIIAHAHAINLPPAKSLALSICYLLGRLGM